ncbi:MAG TPA: FadR/GntR family transcriptional regulator [Desulfatiglandales bacterium]|nr:FadR/GntR family transcriptional regulator [Desulfatiglandales bacterium]
MAYPAERNNLFSEAVFRPLEKRRYSEQIADLIQDKILRDHLEIGTSLPSEKDLSLEFQVSRSVIREALRMLEVSGLVKIKKGPSGGIFVSNGFHKPITNSLNNLITLGDVTIDHLFDVRLLIEPHIAMEAALNAKNEHVKKLKELIDDSSNHQDDPIHLKRNNLKFHLLVAKASGNPVLSLLLESVIELLVKTTLDFLDLSLERHFFRVHERIAQVIAQGESEEAERLVREDILDTKEKIERFRGQ